MAKRKREKSETQIYLEQVQRTLIMIDNKLIEQQQWNDLAYRITANMGGEKVQSTGNHSKMADAVNSCLEAEGEIFLEVENLRKIKKEVVQTIERLDSFVEYDLLHMRYIQFKSLQDVADKYKKEYGWAKTTHGRALKHVQEIREKGV